jgi:hypothetical protein
MSGIRIQHKSSTLGELAMNSATQNKRGRRLTATSSCEGGERGIRTPGPGFPRLGISSAAAVGSTTLSRRDKMPRFIGFFASAELSKFCQNRICQKPVKNWLAGWVARAAFLSNAPPWLKPRIRDGRRLSWTAPRPRSAISARIVRD